LNGNNLILTSNDVHRETQGCFAVANTEVIHHASRSSGKLWLFRLKTAEKKTILFAWYINCRSTIHDKGVKTEKLSGGY
jgi:hypothetical protein